MRRFKKRTIALVLASVVTVVGAFGANSYKNSLMGLRFNNESEGTINLIVQTKSAFDGNITPMRKDANTYVLTLPEMNSEASTPDLSKVSSNISSVNIRTMPYSNSAKGYTRITIKTNNPSINLSATNQVAVATSNNENLLLEQKNSVQEVVIEEAQRPQNQTRAIEKRPKERSVGEVVHQEETPDSGLVETPVGEVIDTGLVETPIEETVTPESSSNTGLNGGDNTYLWLWALLIVLGSAFFYTKAKNKMQEIAGEKIDIDVNEKGKKDSKRKKIKNAINTLDATYSKTATMPSRSEYSVSTPVAPVKTAKPAEELDIVDLDELFQEHKAKTAATKEEEENDALEDFLSGFSFDDTEEKAQEEEVSAGYDEKYYEKLINSNNINFSQDDINCVNQLLDSEINDETMRNIENYAVSNPMVKKPSKDEVVENLVTDYAVSQNITFTQEDIKALYKLISVELDNDFITDLRTNPVRTEEMEKDILAYGDKPKKPSEIITLSVKDMLPDLSDALKKQGNRKIESNRKAETIYFSEGYEVSTLSLSEKMPDLSLEINNKDAYKTKPSANYDIVDNNYTVGSGTLKISSQLPDLQDVMAHPEKYEKQEAEDVVVDAEALLKNISNVQFKPFDDGTREFEVLNDFSDAPTVSDIQAEMNQFEGFEIKGDEPEDIPQIQDDYDDFKALYSNEYVDLDKQEATSVEKIESTVTDAAKPVESAQDMIKRIEASKIEKEVNRVRIAPKEVVKNIEDSVKSVSTQEMKCVIDGITYNVISSAAFSDNKGCYLAKYDKGYIILGYIGEKLIKINEYETFKSEKIHARLSEKLPSGTLRYIVRVGIHKLIVNVKDDNIEYVMDLC